MPITFKRTRLLDLPAIERAEYKLVIASATARYPRLSGNIRNEDGWSSIGCTSDWLLPNNVGFRFFLNDIGRKRIVTSFHQWTRPNPNIPWSKENIAVTLKPEHLKQVCGVIREELDKSKDIKKVLAALNEMGCPSDNGRAFTELGLKEFIRLNRI